MDTTPHEPTRSVDDFAEFLTASYATLIAAFAESGMSASIESGTLGHYLLVMFPEATPEVGITCTVEVTSGGKPIPPTPADVTAWTLTSQHEDAVVAAEAGPPALVQTVLNLLGPARHQPG